MDMTKEEFLEGIHELARDFADPDGEFSSLLQELEGDEVRAVTRHDPELGRRFDALTAAVRELGTYVQKRVG